VNVSEYRSDVAAMLEDLYRFVGVSGLKDLKTRVFGNLDGPQANERFIVDDKDHGPFLPAFGHTLYSHVFCGIPAFLFGLYFAMTTMCQVDSFRRLIGRSSDNRRHVGRAAASYLFSYPLL
jgi:hypothetical protein